MAGRWSRDEWHQSFGEEAAAWPCVPVPTAQLELHDLLRHCANVDSDSDGQGRGTAISGDGLGGELEGCGERVGDDLVDLLQAAVGVIGVRRGVGGGT